LDEDTRSKSGIVLDDDPFARVEGVTMLRPLSSFGEDDKDRESVVSESLFRRQKALLFLL
jgi:hypothetical protein